jgi:uncharacterized protein
MSATDLLRPHPRFSPLTEPFWTACSEHRLIVQQCAECERRFFTPEAACTNCQSFTWTWVESPGIGTVYTFTIVHRAAGPGFDVPYALAAVDLDDGWTMMSQIVDCAPDEVAIGQRVAVCFVEISDALTLPCFSPVAASS